MTRLHLCLLVAGALWLPNHAFAQDSASNAREPFRRWDLGGGVGFRFDANEDASLPHGQWDAQLSRYWTAHFNTSVTASSTAQTTYVYTNMPGSYRFTRYTSSPAAMSMTAGYQFFENVFVHPYLSAGARLGWASETSEQRSTQAPFGLVTVSSSPSRTHARALVGGGFKSYFDNGRAFMRTELMLVVDPQGSSRTVVRIGAGVDF